MKKSIQSFIIYLVTIFFVVSFFSGISLPKDTTYWWAVLLAFALSVFIHKPILKFFTLKSNFFTFVLIGTALLTGTMIGLSFVIPGYTLGDSVIKAVEFGSVKIESFVMDKYIVAVVSSFISALVLGLLDLLKKDSE